MAEAEEFNGVGSRAGGRGDRHSSSGPGPRRGTNRRYQGKPKVCQFCVEKTMRIDYKQSELMRRFIHDSGKIRPRRQTGTCARHQRLLAVALKRARHLALIPYVKASSR